MEKEHMSDTSLAVSLPEMLDARERRLMLQTSLISHFQTTIVCLTLNIPGPVKVLPGVPQAYEAACRQIEQLLQAHDIPILQKTEQKEKTGWEAFYPADTAPETAKRLMVSLEEQSRFGRLLDIDVLRTDGSKVSREEIGFPPRTCLLCREPAHVCSRSRRHTVAELTAEVERILADHIHDSGKDDAL
ncbi:MAG: citrate lyase holo-[acyl-carrier protein] synthase [Eubacteriales bacterium]|nr:citrate lyase holo-[acyl-carrier protein] synthase [Eubacteriales bacterium]